MSTLRYPHRFVLITSSLTCQPRLCPCGFAFLVYLFPPFFFFTFKNALEQMPLEEQTPPCRHPHTNDSVVFHSVLLWKQQECETELRYHCREKKLKKPPMCVSRIPSGTSLSLSGYLAVRICSWNSSWNSGCIQQLGVVFKALWSLWSPCWSINGLCASAAPCAPGMSPKFIK